MTCEFTISAAGRPNLKNSQQITPNAAKPQIRNPKLEKRTKFKTQRRKSKTMNAPVVNWNILPSLVLNLHFSYFELV